MKLAAQHIDDHAVQVLSEPDADELVVRLPRLTWGLILTAAVQYYEMSAVNGADVLDRLLPSPSMTEIEDVIKALKADAVAVSRLIGDISE